MEEDERENEENMKSTYFVQMEAQGLLFLSYDPVTFLPGIIQVPQLFYVFSVL